LTELIVGIGKWKCVVKGRDPYATTKAYLDVEVIVVVVIAAGGQAVDLLHYHVNPLSLSSMAIMTPVDELRN
jgi:uncharacterized membrane protein